MLFVNDAGLKSMETQRCVGVSVCVHACVCTRVCEGDRMMADNILPHDNNNNIM